ncbi:hypothetical protein DSOL_2254 [Desulfosporosinus metallidurans]|uniref:Uncharacterized protein n=1 Tax=Desulfosporosinus metallidurans TaxID=1888891 RepID=A0A1Q8QWR8_9FIRM|nr:hypothetical protein DSOL_2254 [Desulfosporosinus metallidurans]
MDGDELLRSEDMGTVLMSSAPQVYLWVQVGGGYPTRGPKNASSASF